VALVAALCKFAGICASLLYGLTGVVAGLRGVENHQPIA
jgi:hypothetical protein